MKERTKDVFALVMTLVITLVIGCCLGTLAGTLFGCGQGPGYLGLGLVIEDLLDSNPEPVDGADGTHCWDLDGSGECENDEDVNGDAVCDALDCQGVQGDPGDDGADSTVPGPTGPAGAPGVPTPGTTTVIVVHDPAPPPDDDGPPPGHAYGHNDPPGNSHKP